MIETSKVLIGNKPVDFDVQIGAYNGTESSSFKEIIYDELKRQDLEKMRNYDTVTTRIAGGTVSQLERNSFEAQALYSDSKKSTLSIELKEQFKKYKEDQLLSNPGGDHFNLDKDTDAIDYNNDQSKFNVRVGKDLKDAGENFINIFKDMGPGATFKYVDKDGCIQEGKKVGFGGTMVNFLKDMASGVTLGKYPLVGENPPDNALEATKHFFKKIFVDAILRDMVVGMPRSAIHVGENVVFTCINLAEIVPDATIGNYKAGRETVTEVFDDTQVLVDFVTDIIPTAEAGSRTRAFTFKKGLRGLPIINNITTPEQGAKEENWKYVRNTPLRKVVESMATLIPVRI
ncbi:MAG: hypothetical protein NG747_15300 [Candidatus Brocadia sp.]|nr:hypothetical protein [Candidatus Brocadia sp.]